MIMYDEAKIRRLGPAKAEYPIWDSYSRVPCVANMVCLNLLKRDQDGHSKIARA
jgi:hypothetical protein